MPQGFVVTENEGLVLANGTTQGKSILVAAEFGFVCCKEVPRIEIIIPQKLIDRSVNFVRAGFGDQVDRGTGRPAEGGGINIGLNLEFLNSIRGGLNGKSTKGQVPGI